MYYLLDRPKSTGVAAKTWDVLDAVFGTDKFTREDAASALAQAGAGADYETIDRLVSRGYALETN